jgi:hypothetical protein
MGGKVQMIFEGDEKKLADSLDRQRTKLRNLQAEFDKLKAKGKSAGDGVSRGMKKGTGSLAKMRKGFTQLIGPIASVGAAVGTVTKLMGELNEERLRGAAMAKDNFGMLQQLGQISKSPADFRNMIRMASDTSIKEGVPFNEAGAGVFAGRSLEMSDREIKDLQPVARLVGDYGGAIRGVGKMFAGFTRKETGSARAIFNKMGVAAETSDVSLDEFAPEAIGIAAPFRQIGLSDEEGLAAMSVLSAGQGATPAIAATQLKSLATAIFKSDPKLGVKGLNLADAVRKIKSMPESDQIKHFLGRAEAARGLQGLTDKMGKYEPLVDRLHQEEALTDAGSPDTYLKSKLRNFESLGLVRSLLGERRSGAVNVLSEMASHGEGKLDWKTLENRAYTALREDPFADSFDRFQGRLNMGWFKAKEWAGLGNPEQMREYIESRTGASLGTAATGLRSLDRMLGPDGGEAAPDGPAWVRLQYAAEAMIRAAEAMEKSSEAPKIEDRRVQTFYGNPNERSQMRSPAGRHDSATGR